MGAAGPLRSRSQLLASTEAILSDKGVRAQGSPDMMKIWDGR
jgi:hypothetical protein